MCSAAPCRLWHCGRRTCQGCQLGCGSHRRPGDTPALQSEAVEVVNQGATHKCLYGFVQVAQLNLLGHRFGIINVDPSCGTPNRARGHHTLQFRRLRASAMKICVFFPRNSIPVPDLSSRMNVAPPDVPTPGIAGGGNENANPDGTLERARCRWAFDSRIAGLWSLAFLPRFQRDEEEGTVSSIDAAQHAVAHDGANICDSGRLHDGFFHFASSLRRALQRAASGN